MVLKGPLQVPLGASLRSSSLILKSFKKTKTNCLHAPLILLNLLNVLLENSTQKMLFLPFVTALLRLLFFY